MAHGSRSPSTDGTRTLSRPRLSGSSFSVIVPRYLPKWRWRAQSTSFSRRSNSTSAPPCVAQELQLHAVEVGIDGVAHAGDEVLAAVAAARALDLDHGVGTQRNAGPIEPRLSGGADEERR